MQVFLAQVNPTVGDLEGNLQILRQVAGANSEANLIVFPELFLTGFPPQDLLFRRRFLQGCRRHWEIQEFSKTIPETAIVVGTPWPEAEGL